MYSHKTQKSKSTQSRSLFRLLVLAVRLDGFAVGDFTPADKSKERDHPRKEGTEEGNVRSRVPKIIPGPSFRNPQNPPPMLVNTPRQRNLFANLGASRVRQHNFRQISLDTRHTPARGGRTNVEHENLLLGKLLDLGLLLVVRLDTKETAEEEVIDFELGKDFGKLADAAQHLTDETVGTAQGRVDFGSHTNQSSRNRKLEVILLGKQRHDAGIDGPAANVALLVLGDDARSDLDFVAELQNTLQDGTSGDASFELVNFGTRFVDVEGTDDDEFGGTAKVAGRDRDFADNVLVDDVDVVLELRRNGYDGSRVRDRSWIKIGENWFEQAFDWQERIPQQQTTTNP